MTNMVTDNESRPIDTVVLVCLTCQEYRPHYMRIRGDISTKEEWREMVCDDCETVARRVRVKAPVIHVRAD